ncbi:hypothetical protein COB55_02995 [Candidatus Wolfebacteria bacterium]|nr:MAG: hypothetical protein COB55_02995 [Candidatus Wolfebacteria bacterium]
MNDRILKRNIMRRVYFACLVRKLKNPLLLKTGAILVLGTTTLILVSVKDIMINAPWTNPMSLYQFSTHAFMHTEIMVKLLTISVVGSGIWITRKAFAPTDETSFANTA